MDDEIYETPVSLLSTSVWLSVPAKTREKLVQLFDIQRSGDTEVNIGAGGAEIISDGYTPKDLMVISTDSMQKLLNNHSSSDFYQLFHTVVDHIDDLLDGDAVGDETAEEGLEGTAKEVVNELPKKKGRPAKAK